MSLSRQVEELIEALKVVQDAALRYELETELLRALGLRQFVK